MGPGQGERAGAQLGGEHAPEVALASTPAASASPGTPSRSTTPSPISRIARPARSARTFQSGEPGTASGRQRRQARKPRSWAAAAVGQNSTFVRLGVTAGQEGRQ